LKHYSFRLAGLWLLAAVLVAFGAIACGDDPLADAEAQLLAPPNVPPSPNRTPSHVVVNLETIEKQVEIAPGVQYTVWTFNGSVPGPMIRVKVGDTVEVHLKNSTTSTMTHNIDLHAVNGPGGGAGATSVAPGEEKVFSFKALAPGFYVYHCAAGIVADHIANGMYGGILVEPSGGLEHVDHEYYVGQSEFYTTGDTNAKGMQEMDMAKLLAEDPTYVVFNGNTKALIGDNALKAKVGDTVRIYVANGGPNLISSFHVIGEIFDRVWEYGAFNRPLENVQTVLVPPGGSAVVQFTVNVPGDYKLVDHALSRASKGGVGTLHVEGAANPRIFQVGSGVIGADTHDMSATTPKPAATATATATATTAGAAPVNGTIEVAMKDNLFEPKTISLKAGQTVTFNLTNQGKVIHNMRIADATGNYDGKESVVSDPELVGAGKTGTLKWTAPAKAGVYKFRCDVHPDQMTGTITVD
jgi:nitrite reductase (NO-forming)